MRVKVHIEAGVCGFRTDAEATSEDNQYVVFQVTSDCEKIRAFAERIRETGEFDAYQEISPSCESALLGLARETLCGCCAACAVPVGLFKAMQVAAGLALPANIAVELTRE
jgi:hypothetical protein